MKGIATTFMSVSELKAQRLRLPSLRELGRGGDPGVESGDQGRSDARGAGRRAPGIVILAGGDKRWGRRAVRGRRGRARQQLVEPGAVRGREGLKQLQFVLPAGKKLPPEYLVGAGREQSPGASRAPAPVRLSARSKLSRECAHIGNMCRQKRMGNIRRLESTGNVWQGPGGQCWPREHKCRVLPCLVPPH